MASALPNFEHFPVHSDEATLGTRWKRWLTRFEILLTALSVTEKARKKALLLHYAGDEVFTIYESFTAQQRGEGDDVNDEYKALVDSFNAHFTPKRILILKHSSFVSAVKMKVKRLTLFILD